MNNQNVSIQSEPENLSSGMTFTYKYIFPALWIVGYGLGPLAMFTGKMLGKRGVPPPVGVKWLFLLTWIVGTGFILFTCRRLKKVSLTVTDLIISNFQEEVRVPLTMVSDVIMPRLRRNSHIVVKFEQETIFGREIYFVPKFHFYISGSDPILVQLQESVANAKKGL